MIDPFEIISNRPQRRKTVMMNKNHANNCMRMCLCLCENEDHFGSDCIDIHSFIHLFIYEWNGLKHRMREWTK